MLIRFIVLVDTSLSPTRTRYTVGSVCRQIVPLPARPRPCEKLKMRQGTLCHVLDLLWILFHRLSLHPPVVPSVHSKYVYLVTGFWLNFPVDLCFAIWEQRWGQTIGRRAASLVDVSRLRWVQTGNTQQLSASESRLSLIESVIDTDAARSTLQHGLLPRCVLFFVVGR